MWNQDPPLPETPLIQLQDLKGKPNNFKRGMLNSEWRENCNVFVIHASRSCHWRYCFQNCLASIRQSCLRSMNPYTLLVIHDYHGVLNK